MTIKRVATQWLALALLLLSSCMRNVEPPTPTVSPTGVANIEALKQVFLDKKYDQHLIQQVNGQNQPNNHRTWTPLWAKATQTTLPDSATYTYVPLELRVEVRPYVLTLVGIRKYLRFKQTVRGLTISESSYLFVEKAADAVPVMPARAFFARFTGVLVVKDFATGEVLDFFFKHGVRQPNPQGQRGKKSGNRPNSCYTTVTCDWTGVCATEPGNTPVYAATTYGLWGCGMPGDDGVGCSRIVWTLTRSNYDMHCSPDGPGDSGSGPGDGTNGGTNGDPGNTGPTPPTNLNSPCGKMYTLGQQQAFQEKGNLLLPLLYGRYENGFIYRNNGISPTDYLPIIGTTNSIGGYPPPFNIDGHIHIHNIDATNNKDAALSTFSMNDISLLYAYEHGGYMNNPYNFTMTVYTVFGVDYAIKIDDINLFRDFGRNYFREGDIDATYVNFAFLGLRGPYPMDENLSVETNERSLLKFLKDKNSGLTVFKRNRSSNSTGWQQIAINANDQVFTPPCP